MWNDLYWSCLTCRRHLMPRGRRSWEASRGVSVHVPVSLQESELWVCGFVLLVVPGTCVPGVFFRGWVLWWSAHHHHYPRSMKTPKGELLKVGDLWASCLCSGNFGVTPCVVTWVALPGTLTQAHWPSGSQGTLSSVTRRGRLEEETLFFTCWSDYMK